ncbi:MAG: hypothetical protein ABSA83_04265 [Verrucomicrobiota bacterium]|jgi:hypothetical membrane protein
MNAANVPRLPGWTRLANVSVPAGMMVIALGIAVGTIGFDQNHSLQPYSFWNHATSELGFPFTSPVTWFFNSAVAISALLFVPSSLALLAHWRSRLALLAAFFGCAGSVALCGLGLFGLRQDLLHTAYSFGRFYPIHMAFADAFFGFWTLSIALFTLVLIRLDRASRFDPLVLNGTLCCLVFGAFLAAAIHPNLPYAMLRRDFRHMLDSPPTTAPLLSRWLDSQRPPIFWLTAFEWLWVACAMCWHGFVLRFLSRPSLKTPGPAATLIC